jgi:hypothetical protein
MQKPMARRAAGQWSMLPVPAVLRYAARIGMLPIIELA